MLSQINKELKGSWEGRKSFDKKETDNVWFKYFFLASLFSFGFLLVIYVLGVNFYALRYYSLREAKLKISDLKHQYDTLLIDETELRSLEKVNNSLSSLEMEKSILNGKETVYLENAQSILVKK